MEGRIGEIRRSAQGGVQLEGVRLSGAGMGAMEGQLRVANRDVTGTLKAQAMPLEPLRRLLGLPYPLRGTVDIDVALTRTPAGRQGHARFALHDGGMLVIQGVQADVAVELDGVRATPRATLSLALPETGSSGGDAATDTCGGTIASIQLEQADLDLRGPLLDLDTYRQATGKLSLRAPGQRLGCIGQVLAQVFYSGRDAPLEALEGTLDASVDLAREPGSQLPSVRELKVTTHGLKVVPRAREGEKRPWSTDGVDVAVVGDFDGATGQSSARASLLDPDTLVQLDASASFDVAALAEGGERAASSLVDTPLEARLQLPRRSFAQLGTLPEPARSALGAFSGQLQVGALLEGTLRDPSASLRVQGWDVALGVTPTPAWALPIDLDLQASYARSVTTLTGTVAYQGKSVASGSAALDGDLVQWIRTGAHPPIPWTGRAGVGLTAVPLDALPPLAARDVHGALSGQLSIEGLGALPRPTGELRVDGLRIGASAQFRDARMTLRPSGDDDGRTVVADVALAPGKGGGLQATGYAGLTWDGGWVPDMNRQAPADLLVRAEAFPLETVYPFVAGAVSKLDGVLDGDVRLQWHQVATGRDADLLANVTLRDGAVHIPQLGQELGNVAAKIAAADGVVRVENITATATTGRATGWLTARLDGLALRDLNGELNVAEGEAIPVTLEGLPLGTAHGRVVVHALAKPDEIQLNLTGQGLRIVLQGSTSQSVQPLADNPDVEIVQPLGPSRASRSAEGLPWNVAFALLDTEVRGTGVRLLFSSSPTAPPTVHTAQEGMTGELVIEGGELDFLGVGSGLKLFVVDRGIVRFERADPSNPYVNVRAHYDAADGSTITAEYVGQLKPVTSDKLRFSSSPARTQEEILAMLLFGETEATGSSTAGAAGASRSPGGATGTTGGGSIAAQQLNALLGGIAPLRGLSTSFGTTSEGYTSTGLAYQITDTVTAQAAFERRSATAADAANADQSAGDGTAGDTRSRTRIGVDWRFYEDWLLRGSLGLGDDPTSGLDLMWQYRY